MNFFYLALISVLISACASQPATYRFLIGARNEVYTEKEVEPLDVTLQKTLGGTITTTEGDRYGFQTPLTGGQIGVIEELASGWVTTLSFFFSTATKPVEYKFNSSQYGVLRESVSLSGMGLDAAIGYRLGWFRPQLSYKLENQKTNVLVEGNGMSNISNTSQSIFVFGGGLALEIPISSSFRLLLQGDYRIPTKKAKEVESANYQTAQLSLLFGNW